MNERAALFGVATDRANSAHSIVVAAHSKIGPRALGAGRPPEAAVCRDEIARAAPAAASSRASRRIEPERRLAAIVHARKRSARDAAAERAAIWRDVFQPQPDSCTKSALGMSSQALAGELSLRWLVLRTGPEVAQAGSVETNPSLSCSVGRTSIATLRPTSARVRQYTGVRTRRLMRPHSIAHTIRSRGSDGCARSGGLRADRQRSWP